MLIIEKQTTFVYNIFKLMSYYYCYNVTGSLLTLEINSNLQCIM